jgi:long-chain acyl-CoA synthetase
VILGETTISYAQLDALSDRVAASLSKAGMAVGNRVGLQLPNIPQFVIAYFGILKAGGVVVPMNVLLKAPARSSAGPATALVPSFVTPHHRPRYRVS